MKAKNGKTQNWQKLNDFFAEASALEISAQSDFVRKISDKNLRGELEAMLKAVKCADQNDFLKKDAFSLGADLLVKNEIPQTRQIGKYKIIKELGRGGMGAVFLAEREDFKQKVALKLIKRGMDTDEIIRRFRQERQVLAKLEHPNIAHLLDGGTTDDGLPFFVMEYVEGETLTKYCEKNNLNIEKRLALFRKVCAAVAYAHQNLIVHRDIKPSNIIVNNDGEPKLLDFGISKLLAPNAFEMTVEETKTGAKLMTPEYASPEQIKGETITTATDIYSLGVLLYELLSGHRPFAAKDKNYEDVVKIILTEEPLRPSSVVSSLLSVAKETDENKERRTKNEGKNPKSKIQNPKSLIGDLDNIVLMSLRKEPSRRYSSVEQFSEDLRRHLVGLPVSARPATLGYRTAKFIERNRTAVSFASIALIALLAGLSIAIWQAAVAKQERERAERRLTEIRKLTANLVSGWDKNIPETQVTAEVRGRIADISAEYLEGLANEINDPKILKELAEAYLKLGHEYSWAITNAEKAKTSFQKAESIARQLIEENPQDLEAKDLLIRSLEKYDGYFGENDREESLRNHFERLRLSEEIYNANPNDAKALGNLSNAVHNCGWILNLLGRREESLPYYRRSNELYKQRIELLEPKAQTSEDRVKLVYFYGHIAMNQAEFLDEIPNAFENFRRASNLADEVYRENPEDENIVIAKVSAQRSLGLILKKTKDFRASNEAYRVGLETVRNYNSRFPNGYFFRQQTDILLELAENFNELGDEKSALESLHESLAVWKKYEELETQKNSTRNDGFHAYLYYLGGKLLTRMNRFDEANKMFEEAEIYYKKTSENKTIDTNGKRNFANLYLTMGDLQTGAGICKFAESPFGGLANQSVYCPSEIKTIPTNDRERIAKAKKYYENALDILTEIETKNLSIYQDKENFRIAREKILLCNEKLNSKP